MRISNSVNIVEIITDAPVYSMHADVVKEATRVTIFFYYLDIDISWTEDLTLTADCDFLPEIRFFFFFFFT